MTPPDHELLEKFRTGGHEPSFTELVNRHIGLVHSAALRITCQPALAQEVSQSVFTKLARLGSPLKGGLTLVTWLHQTTRSTAIDLVRAESRRRKREEIAASLATMSETPVPWEHISPVLDEVIDRLSPDERHVVLSRYFEGQSHAELARSLGLSEDATRMRVNRALEKIRTLLHKRGITTTASALSLALPAQAMTAVPSGLAASITTTALAASAAPVSIITIGIITMTKKTALAASAALLIAGAGTVVYIASSSDSSAKSEQAASNTALVESNTPSTDTADSSVARTRGRDRSAGGQGPAEDFGLVSRYGESRVKMAKRITTRVIGFLGDDGLGGFMPMIERQAKQENLSTLSAELKLSDEQKAKVEALIDKTSEQKAAQLAAVLDYLKANTLLLSETLLAGDAFKRGEISEQEYKEIASRLDTEKANFDNMLGMNSAGDVGELMTDQAFASGLKSILDPSQIALLEEQSQSQEQPPAPAPAAGDVTTSADIGMNLGEAELLESLDEKVTSIASMFDGLKKVMESMKAMEALEPKEK